MSTEDDIPTLTDLIEKRGGDDEIRIADLGLDDADLGLGGVDIEVEAFPSPRPAGDPLRDNPALEQTVRRILDEHMELAWQEIKLAIQQEFDKS
ncbi:MAG TPA: hypothetical protein VIW27_06425 [Gammaproteobacteria bacterium]